MNVTCGAAFLSYRNLATSFVAPNTALTLADSSGSSTANTVVRFNTTLAELGFSDDAPTGTLDATVATLATDIFSKLTGQENTLRSAFTVVELSESAQNGNLLSISGLEAKQSQVLITFPIPSGAPFDTDFDSYAKSYACLTDSATITADCPLGDIVHTCDFNMAGLEDAGQPYFFDLACPLVVPTCLFWNTATNTFASEGVELDSYTATAVTCASTHLTGFAVGDNQTEAVFTFGQTKAPTQLPTLLPTGLPTFPPSPVPIPIPTPAPTVTFEPTRLTFAPTVSMHPTPLPSISLAPTPSPTNEDTTRLDVSLGLSPADAATCTLVQDNEGYVKGMVASAMSDSDDEGDLVVSADDVVYYDVSGCADARRNLRRKERRRHLASAGGGSIVVTLGFSTSVAGSGVQSAQALYTRATSNLKESVGALTSALAATCGCDISVDTVKVAITRRAVVSLLDQRTAPPSPEPEPMFYAGGDCPNGCSGHGACSTNGCVCYEGWGNGDDEGGACDSRICAREIAWVATPTGENRAHGLEECAGRGVCDRETGDCACFPGYEGKGCRRSSCPNGCSGHGTCEYLSELRNDLGDAFKWTGGQSTRDQYDFEFPLLWDAYKTRGCVCDPKWSGLDCSSRMCPRSDYSHFHALDKLPETQAVILTNIFTPGTDEARNDFYDNLPGTIDYKTSDMTNGTDANGEFALTFRSTLNEEFTTRTLNAYNLTEEMVEAALGALPNKVIEDAHVLIYRNLSQHNLTSYYKDRKWNGLKRGFSDGAYPFDHQSNVSRSPMPRTISFEQTDDPFSLPYTTVCAAVHLVRHGPRDSHHLRGRRHPRRSAEARVPHGVLRGWLPAAAETLH